LAVNLIYQTKLCLFALCNYAQMFIVNHLWRKSLLGSISDAF